MRNPAGKERRLAKFVSRIATSYELIIIDCAPTDSVLTDAAYFASRFVLVPIKPEFLASVGLPLLARSLIAFRHENEDQKVEICGIAFVNSSSYSTGPESRQSVAEVTDFARSQGWPVFNTHVKYSASYARAARSGMPVRWTRNVWGTTISNFEAFKEEFFKAIGLNQGA
jgi:chromosome partitioning protein